MTKSAFALTRDQQETIKEEAQSRLMSAMQVAFDALEDSSLLPRDKDNLREAMSGQMARVERIFGYAPGSWSRGA